MWYGLMRCSWILTPYGFTPVHLQCYIYIFIYVISYNAVIFMLLLRRRCVPKGQDCGGLCGEPAGAGATAAVLLLFGIGWELASW